MDFECHHRRLIFYILTISSRSTAAIEYMLAVRFLNSLLDALQKSNFSSKYAEDSLLWKPIRSIQNKNIIISLDST